MSIVLCILDGWGLSNGSKFDAIKEAKTPNYDHIIQNHPHSELEASENFVGLPKGQVGNSEVGHITIGAGRVIFQDLPKIDNSIDSGAFEDKLQKEVSKVTNKRIHIFGLASDGGVHGHINHLIKTHEILTKSGFEIFTHMVTDGRDSAPEAALSYLEILNKNKITPSTISGRYYAMDRDNRWDRTEKAYEAIMKGESPNNFTDPANYIKQCYSKSLTDEFFEPAAAKAYSGIKDGDAIIFLNYRTDRIRQIASAFLDSNFNSFAVKHVDFSSKIIMTQYSSELEKHATVLFPRDEVINTLGEVISNSGKKQLRIAETEKYAHVTYFFNGGREAILENEERILIPSPDVATYDLKPEMSSAEISLAAVENIEAKKFDFICINFANGDMVGHTGNFNATVTAVESIDTALGKIYEACKKNGSELLITADHGNAEDLYDDHNHQPLTAHTLNKVPLIYCGENVIKLKNGALSDVAPTILELMNIKKPKEMTGNSLIEN